jgi:hypothetical protein
LLSVLFYFVFCNKWLDPKKFLLEKTYLVFICQEHSIFHSYRSTSALFLELHLAFVFRLDFVQILLYLCIKVYLDQWSMLVFIKRVV